MKTDYERHDEQYKRRLAKGAIGWNPDADGYPIREAELRAIMDGGRVPSSGMLLELGCGCGNMGLWFAGLGYTVHGIDIAPTAVELAQGRARERDLDATFCVGSVVHLEPYADDLFDFVYDSHLLHCIIGDDRAALFRNVRRVLKPSGYFLVSTMCETEITRELPGFDPETGYTLHQEAGETVARRYIGKQEDLIAEVEAAGFTVLAHTHVVGQSGHAQVFIELRVPQQNKN
jgi:SAM-dependent methyltransferase